MFAQVISYARRHHVGFLALFVALSGTAYAATLPRNSVGTAQLKKNAVVSAKVKNGSLLANDFKSGQLPRGAQGPQGPQGGQGTPGTPGQAGATNVSVRSGGGGLGTDTATCNAGERAVGGGGEATGTDGVLWLSAPTQASGTPTSWDAGAVGTDNSVTAWVVCAAP